MVVDTSYYMKGVGSKAWHNFVLFCWDVLYDNDMARDGPQFCNSQFYGIYGAELDRFGAYWEENDYDIIFPSYSEYVRFQLTWANYDE